MACFPLPDHVTLVYISTVSLIQFAFDFKWIISEALAWQTRIEVSMFVEMFQKQFFFNYYYYYHCFILPRIQATRRGHSADEVSHVKILASSFLFATLHLILYFWRAWLTSITWPRSESTASQRTLASLIFMWGVTFQIIGTASSVFFPLPLETAAACAAL